ncbi:TATA binding protein associated factor 21kDa subunit [Wolffia australiana]
MPASMEGDGNPSEAPSARDELAAEEPEADGPRDARIVRALLRSMGVSDFEPRVVVQLLELWYRYVVDVLNDAQIYSEHASKPSIDPDDVKLAIQSKVNFSFSQPPPREVLMELARGRNKVPLPKSITGPGIPLPPEQDTLISPNYQLFIPRRTRNVSVDGPEEEEDGPSVNSSGGQNDSQAIPQQQLTPQRLSFPLTGVKRPR